MENLKKMIILGYGLRGQIYGDYALRNPNKFEIAAVVDIDPVKCELASQKHGCPVFDSTDGFFASPVPADVAAVAVQDCDHLEVAKKCMETGYKTILLEKPIACNLDDCLALEKEAAKYDATVIVCHVLRYTPFYRAVKKVIDDGTLGDIVTVHASENVGYWHQAHSFVRGPWRRSEDSTPMIVAKCCHDMDLLRWIVDRKPKKIASFGALYYFNEAHAPMGSAEYCSECKVKDCPYNAQKFYTETTWCAHYFVSGELNDEKILSALRGSQYDRCVFRSGNDVVDHEVTAVEFEDGVTACHTMTAFSKDCYRDIKIHGTRGELVGVFEKNEFEIRLFGGETTKVLIPEMRGNHGGGDEMMMGSLYDILCHNGVDNASLLSASIDSHKMAFGAEKSRLSGKVVEIE